MDVIEIYYLFAYGKMDALNFVSHKVRVYENVSRR
jgi:hypothetical protein